MRLCRPLTCRSWKQHCKIKRRSPTTSATTRRIPTRGPLNVNRLHRFKSLLAQISQCSPTISLTKSARKLLVQAIIVGTLATKLLATLSTSVSPLTRRLPMVQSYLLCRVKPMSTPFRTFIQMLGSMVYPLKQATLASATVVVLWTPLVKTSGASNLVTSLIRASLALRSHP